MICPKCGARAGKDDQYCQGCGYPLPVENNGGGSNGGGGFPKILLVLVVVLEICVIGGVVWFLFFRGDDTKDQKNEVQTEDSSGQNKEDTKEKEDTKDSEDTQESAGSKKDTEESETAAEVPDSELNVEAADAQAKAEAEGAGNAEASSKTASASAETAPGEVTITTVTDSTTIANIRSSYTKLTTDRVQSANASTTIQQDEVTNPPINILDDDPGTNWQEGADGSGIGEYVDFTLDQAYTVSALTFRLGNWKTDQYFYGNNRPKTLEIKLGDQSWNVTFPDEWKEFAIQFSTPVSANSLRLIINDIYRGSDWDDTVITDTCIWY